MDEGFRAGMGESGRDAMYRGNEWGHRERTTLDGDEWQGIGHRHHPRPALLSRMG